MSKHQVWSQFPKRELFADMTKGEVRDALKMSGAEYLNPENPVKRRLDIIGGSVLAAGLLLPTAVAIGASTIDTRDNPLFKQERQGHLITKIRTLRGGDYTTTETVDDSRASIIGQFLRDTGIDESTQVIDVLRGTQSLVGARLLMQQTIEGYEEAAGRLGVMHVFDRWLEKGAATAPGNKPGLMSRASNAGHLHRTDSSDELKIFRMNADVEYRGTASLFEDLKIISSTPVDLLQSLVDRDIPYQSGQDQSSHRV